MALIFEALCPPPHLICFEIIFLVNFGLDGIIAALRFCGGNKPVPFSSCTVFAVVSTIVLPSHRFLLDYAFLASVSHP
jgi:hypothetical protein